MYYLQSVYAARSIYAALLDGACLLIAFGVTWILLDPPLSASTYAAIAMATLACSFPVLFFNDAYRPDALGSSHRTSSSLLSTMGFGLVGALVIYFAVPVERGVVPVLASVASIFFPLVFFGRIVLRLMLGMKPLTTNVVVVGATSLGHAIADVLHDRRESGIRMIGFLSDDPALHDQGARFRGFPVLGRVHQLEKMLADRRIDTIVVASKDRNEHFPQDILMQAKLRGIHVESGVSFLERLSGRVFMRDLRPSYLIFGEGFRAGRIYRFVQRTLDITGALFLLGVSFPALLLAALAIKLESPRGSIFYRQTRLGRHDKPFAMCKLRSMREDAESSTGAVFTSDNDDRITRVGYFIRRTRLDELPQLWNVLKGDMGLVGPRAERPEFAEMLAERYHYYKLRTSVRPGITGWAQTRFGYVNNVEAYEEKLALDLYYLKYRSFLLDAAILAQTIKTVLHFRGL